MSRAIFAAAAAPTPAPPPAPQAQIRFRLSNYAGPGTYGISYSQAYFDAQGNGAQAIVADDYGVGVNYLLALIKINDVSQNGTGNAILAGAPDSSFGLDLLAQNGDVVSIEVTPVDANGDSLGDASAASFVFDDSIVVDENYGSATLAAIDLPIYTAVPL